MDSAGARICGPQVPDHLSRPPDGRRPAEGCQASETLGLQHWKGKAEAETEAAGFGLIVASSAYGGVDVLRAAD